MATIQPRLSDVRAQRLEVGDVDQQADQCPAVGQVELVRLLETVYEVRACIGENHTFGAGRTGLLDV